MNATTGIDVNAGFDAVVLAGGASSRLGRNKLNEPLDTETVLQHTVGSLEQATTVVVVGTSSTVDVNKLRWMVDRTDENLILVSEEPPGSGPAMGIAAGIRALPGEPKSSPVLVVGGDMPFVGNAIQELFAPLGESEVAVLVDDEGHKQFLASAWSRDALLTATSATKPGDSVQSLFDSGTAARVKDQFGASFDINQEDDLEQARKRASGN